MKLVVGLGNPGKEYEYTRHNIGFMVLDYYVDNNDWKKKFDAEYQILTIENEKVLFLKPLTYMNNSGISVRKVVDYYDIKIEDILVIQDDLDLEFGVCKLKKKSSSGGHNGIKSIISSLNSDSFCRLKLGISSNRKGNTIDFVLGKFSKSDMEFWSHHFDFYTNIINSFVLHGADKTMNQIHLLEGTYE